MISDVAEWRLTRTTKARPELDGFQMERRQFFQPTVLSVAATILCIAPTAATHLSFLQDHNMSDPTCPHDIDVPWALVGQIAEAYVK
jgi:hypothetical protein